MDTKALVAAVSPVPSDVDKGLEISTSWLSEGSCGFPDTMYCPTARPGSAVMVICFSVIFPWTSNTRTYKSRLTSATLSADAVKLWLYSSPEVLLIFTCCHPLSAGEAPDSTH